MATKAAELAEKAKRAKLAKQAGTISEFVDTLKSERAVQPSTSLARVDQPRVAPDAQPTSAFAKLAKLKKPIYVEGEDDENDFSEPQVMPTLGQEAHVLLSELGGLDPEKEAHQPHPDILDVDPAVSLPVDELHNQVHPGPTDAPTSSNTPVEADIVAPVLSEPPTVPSAPVPTSPAISAISTRADKLRAFAELSRKSKERRQGVGDGGAETLRSNPSLPQTPDSHNEAAWPFASIPAGSKFSEEEWAQARRITDKSERKFGRNDYCVFEFRNAGQGALMRIKRFPNPGVQKVFENGKYVEKTIEIDPVEYQGCLHPIIEDTFDGCLILAPSAQTTHPSAISGEMVFRTKDKVFGEMTYRIVRPQTHEETLPWLYGLKGSFDAAALGICVDKSLSVSDATADQDEQTSEAAPRPRG